MQPGWRVMFEADLKLQACTQQTAREPEVGEMISHLSSCGPRFSAITHRKLPSNSPAKAQGEHLKIKKLTFLINAAEVAAVTAGGYRWGMLSCV